MLEERAINKFENEILKQSEGYDIFLKIGPIIFKESTLQVLKKFFSVKISHHWNSIGEYHSVDDLINEKKFFTRIYSYDKEDCKNYKLEYLANYYSIKNNLEVEEENRIYTIMSDITKLTMLENIVKIMKENNINSSLKLITKNKNIKSKYVLIQDKPLTKDIVMEEMKKSKFILELNRKNNRGCTFRAIECIGLKKKLITTNKEIVNEDFYNQNNILVIEENNVEIPKYFLNSPYEELPREIYEKYSLENWKKKLLYL